MTGHGGNFHLLDQLDVDENKEISKISASVTRSEIIHSRSNDICEGKTVFVRNVPFRATNDDLKQCMLQFGHVYYALICVDKIMECSKGTAFVKFLNKEDADKALNAGTNLTLLGNILDCYPALDRNAIQKKVQEKAQRIIPKDSRNMYLVKEGVIMAGSKAAEGVSVNDMTKRLKIEQYRTQILRNLNMFVSKERLVVHNIPSKWDDKKLQILFKKHGGPRAVIKEARIMRDMKNVDKKGIGKSKEYGFVTFTKHENALMALRNLNNNPNIFSPDKRPIITFSVENKKNLLKRLQKSKPNSVTNCKVHNENNKLPSVSGNVENCFTTDINTNEINLQSHFLGVTTKPGMKEKMRNKHKLSEQAKLHVKNTKRQKKRSTKTLNEKKEGFIKQPKQKKNKRNTYGRDAFAKIINEYKNKLVTVPQVMKFK
ncbi:hypothetical protein NQ315_013985, partial [Exocentrus adspersus]